MIAYITSIAYYLILGRPVIFYLGLLSFLSLCATATFGYLLHHGKIPFKFHLAAVITTFTIVIIHALMAIVIYL